MHERASGKLIKIFIEGIDKYEGKPLYTAIIDKLKSKEISVATIVKGIEGFGEDKKIHADFIEVLSRKLPIVIDIVATEERANEILEIVSPMIKTGKIAIMDNVDVITFKN